jgi:hypothetical protein
LQEVCDQDKTIIASAVAGSWAPGAADWQTIPCDIMHQKLPANCAQNRDPGLPPVRGPSPSPSRAASPCSPLAAPEHQIVGHY